MTTKMRAASLTFVVASLFAPLPVHAQTVQSLAARVATLEASVEKLESGRVVERDLFGKYAAVSFAVDLQASPKVQTETAVGTFTLYSNHTAEVTGDFAHCFLSQPGGAWAVACDPNETGTGSATGVWFIDQDGSLVIEDPVTGEGFINDPNFVGAGGRMIISGGTLDLSGNPTPEIYSLIMILTKLPATPPPPTPTP